MNDELPERKPARLTILPLDAMGIDELHAYIGELRAEIGRAEAMIVRKKEHRGAMEMMFRRPGGSE